MTRSLHLKVWMVLGYVALCTALVLLELQESPPAAADGRHGGMLAG